jgi:hypothetical protein
VPFNFEYKIINNSSLHALGHPLSYGLSPEVLLAQNPAAVVKHQQDSRILFINERELTKGKRIVYTKSQDVIASTKSYPKKVSSKWTNF